VIVVIDGYNVLKQISGQKHTTEHQRKQFIDTLTRYIHHRSLTGITVFDGGDTVYPSTSKHGEVTVIFSGYKQDADSVIKQYCDLHRNHELLLVSSDHELRLFAHALGKQTITAHEFYQRYVVQPEPEKQRASRRPLIKLSDDAPVELDALMQQATQHMPDKDDNEKSVSQRSAQKLSKKERARQRVLDKLR